jgi:LmbE family N-acetylglucosaminyl deacetylase
MLVRYVKKLYGYFHKTRQHIGWYLQYQRECKKNTVITTSSKNYRFERILIIVPHADDELIGCYQFIKSTKAKVFLFYCDMTGSNNDKTNKYIRRKEFEELCRKNGFQYVVSDEIVDQSLQKVVEEYDPNAILLPSTVDWHPQHRAVNNITRIVLCDIHKKPKIIWYQVTVPIDYKWANYYVSMNKQQQNKKWEMFSQVYESQKQMPLMRFKYNERIAGKKYGEYAAETFCVIEFERWLYCMNVIGELIKEQQLDLKASINNLLRIRDMAALLYAHMIVEG